MDLPITIVTELPESLHAELARFLDSRPEWDQDRAIAAALSLFLLQHRHAATPAPMREAVAA